MIRMSFATILVIFTLPMLLSCGGTQADFSNPEEVAINVLNAIKDKDVGKIKSLSCKHVLSIIGSTSEDEIRQDWQVFRDWRWSSVEKWDGNIYGIRYKRFGGENDKSYEANVKFGNLDDKEIVVVNLVWEENGWHFRGINSPLQREWEKWKESFEMIKD
jgi:hypothetical protein